MMEEEDEESKGEDLMQIEENLNTDESNKF